MGAALPDRLQWFRIGRAAGMGCNAVRTSHNMPTPEWVEACDRMGMMMMCETRQMSSSPEGMAQLETMVKRYRNSPSIILWSIGNEEGQLQEQMAEQGARIAATMVRRCHELDPTRRGFGGGERGQQEGRFRRVRCNRLQLQPEFPGWVPQAASKDGGLWVGDIERDLNPRGVIDRSATQHGECL